MPDIIHVVDTTLLAGLCGAAALGYHKIRRVHLKLFELQDAVSAVPLVEAGQQRQYARILEHELGLPDPLPPMRGWAASPDFLLLLARHVASKMPERIVECGSGVSTVVLAAACRNAGRGKVMSLEHDASFADTTRAEVERRGLGEWAEVIHAPLRTQAVGGREFRWYDPSRVPEGQFDMVVVDGPPAGTGPMARFPAGPLLLRRLVTGGMAFLDDSARADEQEAVRWWTAEDRGLTAERQFAEKGCTTLERAPA